jgi:Domain of unknown function (DUF5010)/DUF5010 C-terminal domain/Concanavalin A-like lectin/glucanases superfamily
MKTDSNLYQRKNVRNSLNHLAIGANAVCLRLESFNRAKWLAPFILILALGMMTGRVQAQYLGVTCGFNYNNDLAGPDTGTSNTPLYNPNPANPNLTWDDWAEELGAAGVDFVCPNLRGSQPNTGVNPTNMAPLLTSLRNKGLAGRIKLALFDDNASSWTAQWNQANGRGYGYALPFDMADTNNWKYIYDYNYKLFYQTVPDTNRFKINGRPVIIIWTGNQPAFLTNMQGNTSQALTYVHQSCQRDFGFDPYIILSDDFFRNDTTCLNTNIANAGQNWFTAGPSGPPHTLDNRFGVPIGVAVAQFQDAGTSAFLDPNHGQLFQTGLSTTVGAGALLTLVEGFTDWEEDAACFRVRNLDASGNVLYYTNTYYDYPSQRLNILRRNGNSPFPVNLKLEAEACDYFGGGSPRSGNANYYRNGNINIESTTDTGGGWDVTAINAGQWMEWEEVPIQGGSVHLRVRIASPTGGGSLHFVINNVAYPSMTVPLTGGAQAWTTIDSGTTYQFPKGSTNVVRLVCDTGGFSVNYVQIRDDIPIGYTINIKAQVNNLWVTAPNNGASPLVASNLTAGTTESFTVLDASSTYGYGYVALQSLANNQYVTADTNGTLPLIANAASVGQPQVFQWIDNGNGTFGLRALANQKAVTATNSPTQPLIANRLQAGTAEAFIYATVGQPPMVAAPTGLTATPGNQQVLLSWNESLQATGYNVRRFSPNGNYFTLITTNLTSTVYLDTNLVNGTTYYYVVSAMNTNGESANSLQASATPSAGYAPVVLGDTPWGYWKLNEVTGTTAIDSSTRGLNGTYAAGVSIGGAGPNPLFGGFATSDDAAYFQGLTTSYVSLPALNLNSVNVTFTAWIYPTATTQTGATGLIFWRDSGGHSSGFCYANNGLDLAYNWNDDSSLWTYDSGLNPPANQWSFVALAVTSTNATLYLYNNSEQLSVTNVHSQAAAAFSGAVRIGSDSLNSGVRNFNGGICQAAVFKSSLNQSQINQLYNGATGILPDPLAANLTIGNLNGNVQLKWSSGTLLEATNIAGPWTTNSTAVSPFTLPATATQKFYRVRLQ